MSYVVPVVTTDPESAEAVQVILNIDNGLTETVYQTGILPTAADGSDGQTAALWKYFEELSNIKAKCRTCNAIVTRGKASTNLWKHLIEKHQVTTDITGGSVIEVVSYENPETSNSGKKSSVWNYFETLGQVKGKCKLCAQVIIHRNAVAALWKHIELKHNELYDTLKNNEVTSFLKQETPTIEPSLIVDDMTSTSLDDSYSSVMEPSSSFSRSSNLSISKPRRKRALVWNYFDIDEGGKAAVCKHCTQLVRHHTNTTNLWWHMERYHPHIDILNPYGSTPDSSLAIESPSSVKKSKTDKVGVSKKSAQKIKPEIWNYFTDIEGDGKAARCNKCNHLVRCRNSTTNLLWHMGRYHPETEIELDKHASHSSVAEDSIDTDHSVIVANTPKDGEDAMPHRKKAYVWKFFRLTKDGRAECQRCNRAVSHHNNTTNLWSHLQRKHKDIHLPEQARITPRRMTEKGRYKMLNSTRHNQRVTEALVRMLVVDLHPLSILNDAGIKNLITTLDPTFRIPSTFTVTSKWLPEIYTHVREQLRKKLGEAEYVALSTEPWISCNKENYLSIFAHFIDDDFILNSFCIEVKELPDNFTADGITDILLHVIRNWVLEQKLVGIITDNSEIITEAVRKVGLQNMVCLGKALQLLFEDVLHNCGGFEIVTKCRKVVHYFQKESKAATILNEHQRSLNTPEEVPLFDTETRWITTLHMLKKLWQHHDSIRMTLSATGSAEIDLTSDEWSLAGELVEVLKPLEVATRELTKSKYVGASVVLPLCKSLQSAMSDKPNDTENIASIKACISDSLSTWLPEVEECGYYRLATTLDPRFKTAMFLSEQNLVGQIKEDLMNQMREVAATDFQVVEFVENPDDGTINMVIAPQPPEQDDCLWGDFDNAVKMDTGSISSIRNDSAYAVAKAELENFLTLPVVDRKQCDPVGWWKNTSSKFPNLSRLIKKYFCVSATSIPSTWMFAEEGDKLLDRRSRLQNADIMFFLSYNLSMDQPQNLLQNAVMEEEP